jgi:4'-phosphopantetheinyl transferase
MLEVLDTRHSVVPESSWTHSPNDVCESVLQQRATLPPPPSNSAPPDAQPITRLVQQNERISITLIPPMYPQGAEQPWKTGALQPRLSEGAVHVWSADLEAVSEDLTGLLHSEERVRAERILGDRNRLLWVRARAVLRVLLGRYLGVAGEELRFSTGAHGKPALLDGPRGSTVPQPIFFNLSHSGGLALYAFSTFGEVGVDLEVRRRSIDELALASRVFGAEGLQRLEQLEPEQREQEFLRMWTRHEAELKLSGTGIGATNSAREPWIAELEIGAGAAGAVATAKPPRELSCWRY